MICTLLACTVGIFPCHAGGKSDHHPPAADRPMTIGSDHSLMKYSSGLNLFSQNYISRDVDPRGGGAFRWIRPGRSLEVGEAPGAIGVFRSTWTQQVTRRIQTGSNKTDRTEIRGQDQIRLTEPRSEDRADI